jgi:hypothetical protein
MYMKKLLSEDINDSTRDKSACNDPPFDHRHGVLGVLSESNADFRKCHSSPLRAEISAFARFSTIAVKMGADIRSSTVILPH